jgi:hypothetical protein
MTVFTSVDPKGNINEFDNLFEIVLTKVPYFYNLYDDIYDFANKIFSDEVTNANPPPNVLPLILVSSFYLYTGFYIDTISVDPQTDLPDYADVGGFIFDNIQQEPLFWIESFEFIFSPASKLGATSIMSIPPEQQNQIIHNCYVFLKTIYSKLSKDGEKLLLFIINTFFDGLARYDINWLRRGRHTDFVPSFGGEKFTITQKDAFKIKCQDTLVQMIYYLVQQDAPKAVLPPVGTYAAPAAGGNKTKNKKTKNKKTKKKKTKKKKIKKKKTKKKNKKFRKHKIS